MWIVFWCFNESLLLQIDNGGADDICVGSLHRLQYYYVLCMYMYYNYYNNIIIYIYLISSRGYHDNGDPPTSDLTENKSVPLFHSLEHTMVDMGTGFNTLIIKGGDDNSCDIACLANFNY